MNAGRAIAGAQANLWSETVRSDALVDYMLFPRLIAFAERAWHRASWEPAYHPGETYAYGDGRVDVNALKGDWTGFANRMGEQLRRLDRDGIAYRIAPPGARVVRGMIEANSEFPGQAIEYRARRRRLDRLSYASESQGPGAASHPLRRWAPGQPDRRNSLGGLVGNRTEQDVNPSALGAADGACAKVS